MATSEKPPFYRSVMAAVSGQISGAAAGAVTGGTVLAAGGAVLAAIGNGIAQATVGTDIGTLELVGTSATVGGVVGAAGGALTGGAAGTLTGWLNSRPRQADSAAIEKAHQVELSRTLAVGLMNGAMAGKAELMEASGINYRNDWAQRTGQGQKPPELFVEKTQAPAEPGAPTPGGR